MSLLTELAEEWRARAACRGADPELFFPSRGRDNYDQAREICGRCPVRTDCLNFALRCEPVVLGHRIGFWAGMMPTERRELAANLGRLVTCSECGEAFASRASNARVCSRKCRLDRNARLYRENRVSVA